MLGCPLASSLCGTSTCFTLSALQPTHLSQPASVSKHNEVRARQAKAEAARPGTRDEPMLQHMRHAARSARHCYHGVRTRSISPKSSRNERSLQRKSSFLKSSSPPAPQKGFTYAHAHAQVHESGRALEPFSAFNLWFLMNAEPDFHPTAATRNNGAFSTPVLERDGDGCVLSPIDNLQPTGPGLGVTPRTRCCVPRRMLTWTSLPAERWCSSVGN